MCSSSLKSQSKYSHSDKTVSVSNRFIGNGFSHFAMVCSDIFVACAISLAVMTSPLTRSRTAFNSLTRLTITGLPFFFACSEFTTFVPLLSMNLMSIGCNFDKCSVLFNVSLLTLLNILCYNVIQVTLKQFSILIMSPNYNHCTVFGLHNQTRGIT